MNRLLTKLREFGLVFTIDSKDPEEIATAARGLKKAHIPVILLSGERERADLIKTADRSEDLFIGASCPDSAEAVRNAFSMGAHFAFIRESYSKAAKEVLAEGFEVFLPMESKETKGCEAVILPGESPPVSFPYFLDWHSNFPIPDRHLLNPDFIAAILPLAPKGKDVNSIAREASARIRRFLGMEYLSLTLKENSERLEEGEVFAALSAIPLIQDGERDLLEIGVRDMDRTIAYLKWREIFIDPFSARMSGDDMLSAELYSDFLGWPVRLIRTSDFPAG